MPDQLIYIHIYTLCGYFATIIELLFLNKLISNMKILKVNAMAYFLSFCNILFPKIFVCDFQTCQQPTHNPTLQIYPQGKGKQIFFRRFLDSSVRGCDKEIYTLVRLTGFAVCLEGTQCDALICIATQRQAVRRKDRQCNGMISRSHWQI